MNIDRIPYITDEKSLITKDVMMLRNIPYLLGAYMIYVLDTSSIISDPESLELLSVYHIVLPITTLTELESKRNDREVGYQARCALRYIDSLLGEGDLVQGIPTCAGGSVRVDRTFEAKTVSGDENILDTAENIEGAVLVTEDLPLKLRAISRGVKAVSINDILDSDYELGVPITIEVDSNYIDTFYENGMVYIEDLEGLPVHSSIILRSGTQSALGRINLDGQVEALHTEGLPAKTTPRNSEQKFAVDALTNGDASIVALGGFAGSGKTLFALAHAYSALQNPQSGIRKIIVFRPVEAVGGQELGFLPGTEEEKMAPWAAAVDDALSVFLQQNQIRDLKARGSLEISPLSHIRGRTFRNTIVIVDEAQNLDLTTIVTAMTRVGEGSQIILTYDLSQRDNHGVGKYDGIYKVIKKLTGNDLFAHVKLKKSERSPVADLIARSFHL